MPKNLRDFMSKNNITNSSRDSRDDQHQYGRGRGDDRNKNDAPFKKFPKSRDQCAQQINDVLQELDRKQGLLKKAVETHNSGIEKKFINDYDNLANQIIKYVEKRLMENKDKIVQQIKERRNMDLSECKPINRNIDQLRSQVVSLRDGLSRNNEYRQYMSQIVVKDFEEEMSSIQYNIDRIRFPEIDVRLDDKYYTSFKADLEKLIVIRDQLSSRMGKKGNYGEEDRLNTHSNRDDIKRR